ncbi:MAG: hypothetical protein M1825_003335 [Sarcosagium campestre]|nr:MAG: hypothetical protein M1825_003335 [Sarcosagium campestre]
MSVELSPPELGFRRPFTSEVSQTLRLTNLERDPVAFKVKTTAPKQPNSGRIESGREVEVQVLLQAMKEDPPADAKCRDKFLVQSIAITADREAGKVSEIWAHVDQTAKASVQEKKIRVTFLPAEGAATPSRVNGTSLLSTPDASHPHSIRSGASDVSFSSPSISTDAATAPEVVTPVRGPVSKPESRPADSKHLGEIVDSASNPAVAKQSALRSVTNAIPSSDDVKAQLSNSKETIGRLAEQAKDQGLRQRKSDAITQDARERVSTGTTGMGVQRQPSEGVPVQIVAGLCLLSFLLAYLFF